MKVLVVGLGSIAQRHIKALNKVKPNAEIFALRSGHSKNNISNVINIYNLEKIPEDLDFVIISNPTSEHYKTIEELRYLHIPFFIEKPPLASSLNAYELIQSLNQEKIKTYTAFNLRFHPVITWLKENIKDKRVLEVQAYCGSYLPDWRPEQDYRNVYSAKKKLGGGVHLDLIHELDYVKWLFGEPNTVNAFASRISDLEIETPDIAHYWLEYTTINASIILNYYRRDPKRTIEIVFDTDTWNADLINCKICNANREVLFETQPDIDVTYENQMRYFISCLDNEAQPMNDLYESVETLKMCLIQR